MCLSIMKVKSDSETGKKIFVKHFMNELVRISSDRVVNVRMSLSEVLSVHHA
jgi:KaiC/GvpD/RAD55 family RecA-like ATPase